jgi:hypothetical protein
MMGLFTRWNLRLGFLFGRVLKTWQFRTYASGSIHNNGWLDSLLKQKLWVKSFNIKMSSSQPPYKNHNTQKKPKKMLVGSQVKIRYYTLT